MKYIEYLLILSMFCFNACSETKLKAHSKKEGIQLTNNEPKKNELTVSSIDCMPLTSKSKESNIHMDDELIDNNVYYTDTVEVSSSRALIKNLKSNRFLILTELTYTFENTFNIDSLKNLKITANKTSTITSDNKKASLLAINNSYNIEINNITLGTESGPEHDTVNGVLNIQDSYNLKFSNCNLLGPGTMGMIGTSVYNMDFINSNISQCSGIIFIFDNSHKIRFNEAKFRDNNLSVSVLAGFTNNSTEISFSNCHFLDNTPSMKGNPAFNHFENFNTIKFSNCTFRNNKGFKWYGDYILLENCKIDSSDFINFQK